MIDIREIIKKENIQMAPKNHLDYVKKHHQRTMMNEDLSVPPYPLSLNRPREIPIYIISRGRARLGTTWKLLEEWGYKDYYVVVETFELEEYQKAFKEQGLSGKFVELTTEDKENFFDLINWRSNIIPETGKKLTYGAVPARLKCVNHSYDVLGAKWHWQFDDNILTFTSYFKPNDPYFIEHAKKSGRNYPANKTGYHKINYLNLEELENIAFSKGAYHFAAMEQWIKFCPYEVSNSRCYSFHLMKNELRDHGLIWRGAFNDDTIYSFTNMMNGFSNAISNYIMYNKPQTQSMKGGCSTTTYTDGTIEKSLILANNWPEHFRLKMFKNRCHHTPIPDSIRANALKRTGYEKFDWELPEKYNSHDRLPHGIEYPVLRNYWETEDLGVHQLEF